MFECLREGAKEMARRKWRAAAAMAAAIAFNFAGAAHADIVPGEEIERPDGTLETVVKFDAGKEKVCMRPYAAKECVWRNTEVKRWIALPIGQLCGPQRRLKRAKATPLRDPSP